MKKWLIAVIVIVVLLSGTLVVAMRLPTDEFRFIENGQRINEPLFLEFPSGHISFCGNSSYDEFVHCFVSIGYNLEINGYIHTKSITVYKVPFLTGEIVHNCSHYIAYSSNIKYAVERNREPDSYFVENAKILNGSCELLDLYFENATLEKTYDDLGTSKNSKRGDYTITIDLATDEIITEYSSGVNPFLVFFGIIIFLVPLAFLYGLSILVFKLLENRNKVKIRYPYAYITVSFIVSLVLSFIAYLATIFIFMDSGPDVYFLLKVVMFPIIFVVLITFGSFKIGKRTNIKK